MPEKILVVDDEQSIADIIQYNLAKEGYESQAAYDGKACLDSLSQSHFDLVILDIMMPVMDGFSVLKELRKTKNTPVIILTAKDDEVDKILGLELGADDYVVKPFSMRELMARVKAILRRRNLAPSADDVTFKWADLEVDLNKYEVRKKGVLIELTLREFELLKFLVKTPGQVYSREELLDKVWDYDYYGDIRTVDVTVRRLREKIEDSKDYKYILTKRGVGYYFGG
ncbi:response regulator [Peptoniphilus equinus]|uniref:Response regulator n=1 Tax=Peptoniphilus equinus TaxID=3016343 RepID=A0ABY7QTF7_9FIRM|nr:response regulator [Peptoniphilus equinus]WBW50057.1 response regulator [Peptoniphilus equinus]